MVTQPDMENAIRNIDERTTRIEQILPTLATKDDVKAEGERTRQHFDAVAERLEDNIRLIAEGHAQSTQRSPRSSRAGV